MGDKIEKEAAYKSIGNFFLAVDQDEEAVLFFNLALSIAKELEDKHGQGLAYSSLGSALHGLKDFKKAIDFYSLHLSIAKELKDKWGQGATLGNLGNVFFDLGDFEKAKDYHSQRLNIAKEVGDKNEEGGAYWALGNNFESQGLLPEALVNYQSSVKVLNDVRNLLESKDEWKIGFRSVCNPSYISLWRVLLKQGKTVEALLAAEGGQAQALRDLMRSHYLFQASQSGSRLLARRKGC